MNLILMLVMRYLANALTGCVAGYSLVRASRGEWAAAIYLMLWAILMQVWMLAAPKDAVLMEADRRRALTAKDQAGRTTH